MQIVLLPLLLLITLYFHRFINLFMTKLPPSSLSSCPNFILIPAGEPPWWQWTPGPMMLGPSSTRCWSPWTRPTGYKYSSVWIIHDTRLPRYKEMSPISIIIALHWQSYKLFHGHSWCQFSGLIYSIHSLLSIFYWFILLYQTSDIDEKFTKLHKNSLIPCLQVYMSTRHLAGRNGGSWSWPWSSSTSASRVWPTASASTRWIVIND